MKWYFEWAAGIASSPKLCRFREGTGLSEEEVEAFGNYFFHITAAKGSGEFALPHILAPFAWARHPLEGRLHKLQVNYCPTSELFEVGSAVSERF